MHWATHTFREKQVEAHKITQALEPAGEGIVSFLCDDGRVYNPFALLVAGTFEVGAYFVQHHDSQNWHAEVVPADIFEAEAQPIE